MLHTPSDVHTPSGVPSQDSGDASPFPETSCPGDLVPGAPGRVPIPDRRLGSLLTAGSRAAPPPPAPSQGGSFGLCQSITKREVTSPSRVPPCPRPAYPLPLAAPENMTHPGWGREPSPGVLSPNQAEWAQAALFPTPAPTLGWRLLCLVGAVTVLEAMPRDPNTPQASPSTSWVAPGE